MRCALNGLLAVLVFAPALVYAQDELSGTWQTVLPSGETVIVDLLADGDALDGSVEFENGHIESITEGTVAMVAERPRGHWRVRFVTAGLFNGEDVFLLWDGETEVGSETITMWTTIQLFNGREIELYDPRPYVRIDDN